MKCPFCGEVDTQVKDSRPSEDGGVIRRRRSCPSCNRRFTTFERFQLQQVVVIKQDGQREVFEGSKLLRSLLLALRKRPISQPEINNIVTSIEQHFIESNITEIPSEDIGAMVLEKLKDVDFIGYIRYASVYNDFKVPDDFQKLLDNIQ